ncbi:MAG: hypothetical protein ABI318_24005 [Chthoniobacteraceae bacterium]
MNPTRAAILLAALVLAGCATRTTQSADGAKRNGYISAQERPGLGTSWGEQRESWVEAAPFVRASATRPSAQARTYYNDRDGANAMLAFLGGGAKRCDGLQQTPGGLLRLGLRNGNCEWIECRESRGRRIATGDHGSRYEVVLKNDARRSVEVLVSVDGLDAMDGRPASFKKRGYVLAPFETLAVEGFRTSASTVAAFRFGPMFDSYGHRRHGSTANAGVVGVAVFEEKRRASAADRSDPGDHAWRATAARPAGSTRDFSTPPEA